MEKMKNFLYRFVILSFTAVMSALPSTAFSRMPGDTVTIKPVPWKRGVKLMEEGKGLTLYPPYFRPKLRPFMDYPVPVLNKGCSLMTTKYYTDGSVTQWPEAYAQKK